MAVWIADADAGKGQSLPADINRLRDQLFGFQRAGQGLRCKRRSPHLHRGGAGVTMLINVQINAY